MLSTDEKHVLDFNSARIEFRKSLLTKLWLSVEDPNTELNCNFKLCGLVRDAE